jgi:hypothetical protein
MTNQSNVPDQPVEISTEALPEMVLGGRTLLVACPGQPHEYAVGLQALGTTATTDETAIVVTTVQTATETLETFAELTGDAPKPTLKLVDTSSPDQSLTAVYDETPVIFTPSPGDLERLTVALSDLTNVRQSQSGEQHLVVRSLTPILERAPIDRVETVLERTIGLRTSDGLCLLGIDYTAHDEETIQTLAEHTDGILWISVSADGDIEVDHQPSSGRHHPS